MVDDLLVNVSRYFGGKRCCHLDDLGSLQGREGAKDEVGTACKTNVSGRIHLSRGYLFLIAVSLRRISDLPRTVDNLVPYQDQLRHNA